MYYITGKMTQRVESAVPENERDDVRLLGLEKIQKENLRKGGGGGGGGGWGARLKSDGEE